MSASHYNYWGHNLERWVIAVELGPAEIAEWFRARAAEWAARG